MKPRQQKKLCKKAQEVMTNKVPSWLFDKAWTLLVEQYRGHHILKSGRVWPRPKETPSRVLAWAKENVC